MCTEIHVPVKYGSKYELKNYHETVVHCFSLSNLAEKKYQEIYKSNPAITSINFKISGY